MATLGSIPSSGLYQSESETISANGNLTKRYIVETTDEATFESGYTVGTSTASGLYLQEITKRAAKGFSRYDLKYVTYDELVITGTVDDGISKGSDTNVYEAPIHSHPKYNKATSDVEGYPVLDNTIGTAAYAYLPGVTGFLRPATTYTKTTILNSFTFSEANITEGVGDLESPSGVTSADPDKWMKVGKSVSPMGDKYQVTETWQYAPGGWTPEIYKNGL